MAFWISLLSWRAFPRGIPKPWCGLRLDRTTHNSNAAAGKEGMGNRYETSLYERIFEGERFAVMFERYRKLR